MKIDFVFVTKLDHLYTLNLSIKYLKKHYDNSNIFIVTKKSNFIFFNCINHESIILVDEQKLLPDMTLSDLKLKNLPFFPKRAGWYYQQFLKLAVANLSNISDNYVVIDADTIILKKITFIENNKFVFLKAAEYNHPYFINYELLLNQKANRTFSFISQYMVFNKKIVHELLFKIRQNFNFSANWHWLIINNLVGNGPSLFSEYETYGHFIKNNYKDNCVFIDLPWLRNGSNVFNSMFPSIKQLDFLKNNYYLVSFEHQETRFFQKIFKYSFCKLYPYYFKLKSFFL